MFNLFALAANGTATQPGGATSWISTIGMIVVLLLVFYFFVMRPQKKQEKETKQMRDSLQVGDEITTIGGIIGKVISIKEDTLMIESGHDRTKIRIHRWAIRSIDVHAEDAQQ